MKKQSGENLINVKAWNEETNSVMLNRPVGFLLTAVEPVLIAHGQMSAC